MINVAFLLLIFFLMVAVIAPPVPVDVAIPTAETTEQGTRPAEPLTLYVTRDGQFIAEAGLAFDPGEVRGREVVIRADRSAPATRVAEMIADVAGAGARSTRLAVEGR